ncbi:tryptophan ABC transporter substrate-binding protein [Lactobacillus hamsteri]|uniref:ABC superfamily ATP binding cassette transporter, binding protein n=1 Tax=Lactobacillus hamsteri DSM 5661 = JCM 6256 TaxID=1423754 RepID=A0A0R1YHJ1_9LACO|nr:tryptophan ABC transporter substrate-binding protein [Lactobacillus hamsteri]KRM40388.1 ABC superfamily ATP binding cassette transporter, binding protein [Lactobacillus hamsteri DSM 5661 = JCM 6256]
MKRLIGTIIAIFAFLIVAFVMELKPENSQQGKPTVGILQTMSHPALDQIHKGIIQGLKDEGYIDGKNLKIDFQNAQGDQSNLKSMSDQFQNKNAAAVIGIATPAVQSLANESGNTPVIMGAVSDPIGTKLVKSLKHPDGKVTGVQDKQPVNEQFKLIKTIMPKLKTIGVIYTSSDDSSTAEYREFKDLAEKDGLKVHAYTITSTNDIEQVAQTMAGKVEAVYVPTDNTVASGISTLLKATNAAKIPVFPAADTMIKPGGLATRAVSQFDMGVLTGKMTGQILKGKKPADTPVQRVKKYETIVNEKTARELNIQIPNSIIQAAEKKGRIIR